ncbi:ankyrin repeat domain-containing protein [Mycobacterium hubeiense]|uniref:ankyrin repeat domain-containing protein n=1 Tax=Mycobacterium hubeiense TaxID=1867256 RepID=UPI001E3C2D8B|nr:ankyrin repeat domain-containing protein [Mycobacterium sp. QGD 101]
MARSGRPPKIDPLKPIHRAVMDNDVSTFSGELAAGNDINAPGPEGMTPLHIAADLGNVEFAKALLDAGVEVDPINVWGNTPLWVATMERRRSCPDGSMIRLLLDRGADPTRGEGNNTPLELARMIAGFPEDLVQELEQKA